MNDAARDYLLNDYLHGWTIGAYLRAGQPPPYAPLQPTDALRAYAEALGIDDGRDAERPRSIGELTALLGKLMSTNPEAP